MDNQERPERRTKRVKGARVERGGIVDKLGSAIDTERIKEDIHDRAMSTVTSLVTDTIDGVADVLIGGLEDLLLPMTPRTTGEKGGLETKITTKT